jgi:S-adenosylmethionine synthetase
MQVIIRPFQSVSPGKQEIEIVERKGLGHPDTICDGIAEQICVHLCRYYLKHFGVVLHHNVDKVLLCAGAARVAYGGGEVLHPIEIYVGGRATDEYQGQRIPVHEIAEEASREWLRLHLPSSRIEKHVRIVSRIRPGSNDLIRLFGSSAVAASNDTSCGAGFAPLTDLEKVVLNVEKRLNSAGTKRLYPAIGVDIKVMGVRHRTHISLTVSCAVIDRYVHDIDEYVRQKNIIQRLVLDEAQRITSIPIDATVNAADDIKNQNVFLTVTGSSAEAGDDGEAGRGNRPCGLITPYRAMTLEATAGKNPVTHVGKLYNLLAGRIAAIIVNEINGVTDAQCVLVSQIGRPVTDPYVVDLCLEYTQGTKPAALDERVTETLRAELVRLDELRDSLIAGKIELY